jgi:ribosomal protein S18 acetylase RimI-like enzyme
MPDGTALDHPIWNALTSVHAPLALTRGAARRYPAAVSPLAATAEPTAEALADLAELADPGEALSLLSDGPLPASPHWRMLRERPIEQMVCGTFAPAASIPLLELGAADTGDMAALVALTEPGPFAPGALRMGRYRGLRSEHGRLMAMAGERMRLSAFSEVSAVCTHPDFRGRGYALALVSALSAMIVAEGKTPFLHVKGENTAKRVYEALGFRVRRAIHYSVLQRL